jgi:hypothetical protein
MTGTAWCSGAAWVKSPRRARSGGPAWQGDDPALQGGDHGGRAVVDLRLGEGVQQVGLDRGLADEQGGGDVGVAGPPATSSRTSTSRKVSASSAGRRIRLTSGWPRPASRPRASPSGAADSASGRRSHVALVDDPGQPECEQAAEDHRDQAAGDRRQVVRERPARRQHLTPDDPVRSPWIPSRQNPRCQPTVSTATPATTHRSVPVVAGSSRVSRSADGGRRRPPARGRRRPRPARPSGP